MNIRDYISESVSRGKRPKFTSVKSLKDLVVFLEFHGYKNIRGLDPDDMLKHLDSDAKVWSYYSPGVLSVCVFVGADGNGHDYLYRIFVDSDTGSLMDKGIWSAIDKGHIKSGYIPLEDILKYVAEIYDEYIGY